MKNKNKALLSIAITAIAGTAIYLATRKTKKVSNEKRLRRRDKHLTNVFAHAKKNGGAEFVL